MQPITCFWLEPVDSRIAQPHPRPTTALRDELDAGCLQGSAYAVLQGTVRPDEVYQHHAWPNPGHEAEHAQSCCCPYHVWPTRAATDAQSGASASVWSRDSRGSAKANCGLNANWREDVGRVTVLAIDCLPAWREHQHDRGAERHDGRAKPDRDRARFSSAWPDHLLPRTFDLSE